MLLFSVQSGMLRLLASPHLDISFLQKRRYAEFVRSLLIIFSVIPILRGHQNVQVFNPNWTWNVEVKVKVN